MAIDARRGSVLAMLALLTLHGACSSGESTPKASGPSGSGGSDAGASDAGSDAPVLDSLSLFVGSADYATGLCDAKKTPPLAGGVVAADLPGGTRVEVDVGADGKAKLEGIDWTKGTLALTVWAKDYTVGSTLGLTKARVESLLENGALEQCVKPRTGPTTVAVTGNAKNMVNAANQYVATASSSPGAALVPGAQPYTLPCQTGIPAAIIGVEISLTVQGQTVTDAIAGWTRADLPALSSPAAIDLDFAKKLTTTKVTGKLVLPKSPTSTLRTTAYGYINVTTVESGWIGAITGFVTASAPNATGDAIDYQGEYANVTDIGAPVTLYVLRTTKGVQANVFRLGAPKDGDVIDSFLDELTVVQPVKTGPLHGDIEIASPDAATDGVVKGVFLANAQNELLWVIVSWDSSDPKLRVPALPSKVVATDVIPLGGATAFPAVLGGYDLQYGFFRQTLGKTFHVQP